MEKKKIIVIAAVAALVIVSIIILGVTLGVGNGGANEGDGVSERPRFNLYLKTDCPEDYGPRPLLVVCLDGFRSDYLKRGLTPTLRDFADTGVEAEYMIPSYPTVTFPNHYTIVTGLYPAAHGIIGNNFFDPVFQANFSLKGTAKHEGRWWGGEPIWNTLTRHGKKSASYFWPGSDAPIGGQFPTHMFKYNKSTSYATRVAQVLEWISLPSDDRPQWISLYFNEPDTSGHANGPDSKEVNDALVQVNNYIKMLLDGIIERGLENCINIIIVSDHGMADTGKERVLGVMDYIPDITEEAYFYGGASGKITLTNKSKETELGIMHQLSCKRDEMRVYNLKGFPKRHHFANNQRIEDIIIDLDPGYTVSLKTGWASEGVHGYDNIFPEMNTLFLANGPDFKKELKIKPFQNIELYNLMCFLVGVSPAENNGTWGSLHHILNDPPSSPKLQTPAMPPVLRYPKNDYEKRLSASGCEGDKLNFEQWMPSLNLMEEQEEEIVSYHTPWGIPHTGSLAANISLMYQPDHITGYSSTIKMPLWTSFTIRPDQMDGSRFIPQDFVWASDARLQPEFAPTCDTHNVLKRLNISMVPLFPTAFSSNHSVGEATTSLISNAIPLSQDIKEQWEGLLGSLVPSWVASQGPLNILLGPIFDYNSDSIPDDFGSFSNKAIVPTDLFAVLTRCQSKVTLLNLCPVYNLDSIAFIFHQHQPVSNCLSLEDFSLMFSSRVKDVEQVTGLKLFSKLEFEPRIHHILKMHQQLWPLKNM